MFEITNVRFERLSEPGFQEFLTGNFFDDLEIKITFEATTYSVDVTDEQEIRIAPIASVLTPNTSNLIESDNPIFADAYVGQLLNIVGSVSGNNGTYTVTKKYGDVGVEVSTILINEDLPDGAYIYLDPNLKSFQYKWNFIENNEATDFQNRFFNLVNSFKVDDITLSNLANQQGVLKNHSGSCSVFPSPFSSPGRSVFELVHTVNLRNFLSPNEWEVYLSGDTPEVFLSDSCLKFVCEIKAATSVHDPRDLFSTTYDVELGNTGFRNENFNGNTPRYTADNLDIQDTFQPKTIPNISKKIATTLTTNLLDSGGNFNSSTAKAKVSLIVYPQTPREDLNLEGNMFLDTAETVVNSGITDGDNFGTDRQLIENINLVFNSTNEVELTIQFNPGTGAEDLLNSLGAENYLVFVNLFDGSLPFSSSSSVQVELSFGSFYERPPESVNTLTISKCFSQHVDELTDGATNLIALPGDDITAQYDISFPFASSEDNFTLINVVAKIELRTPSGDVIVLNEDILNLGNATYLNGFFPTVNEQKTLDIGSRRKILKASNSSVLSILFEHTFFSRWEYWRNILGVNNNTDIYNPSEPNDGLNYFYFQLSNPSNTLHHVLELNLRSEGVDYISKNEMQFNVEDFDVSVFFAPGVLKSFNESMAELISGSDKFIQSDGLTLIEYSSEYIGAGSILVDDFEVVIFIQLLEEGGQDTIKMVSSKFNTGSDAWGSSLVEKQLIGTTAKGSAYLDCSKLPLGSEYSVYGRIYLVSEAIVACDIDSINSEDDDCLLVEDFSGENLILEGGIVCGTPIFVSASIDEPVNNKVVIEFSETLDNSSVPLTTDFTLSSGRIVSSINIVGNTVELLTSTYIYQESEEVSYSGTILQSASPCFEQATTFTLEMVTNNLTEQPPVPTLVWLDPSDLSSISEDDNPGKASSISNKGVLTFDMEQVNSAQQPDTNTDNINSLNVLRFNGVETMLSNAVGIINQPLTINMVISVDSIAGSELNIFIENIVQGSGCQIYQNSGNFAVYSPPAAPNVISSASLGALILTVIFNGTFTESYINGVKFNNAVGLTGFDSLKIGRDLEGVLGEITINGQVLTVVQLQQMGNYLSNKWGIPLSGNFT